VRGNARAAWSPKVGFFQTIVVVTAALIALLAAVSAVAQPPSPATLTDITASGSETGAATLLFAFAPYAPNYAILRDGSDHPAIAFALSSRGSTARSPSDLHGLVRSVSFDQQDTVLIVEFTAAQPVRLIAAHVGDKTISLTIEAVSRSARPPPTALAPLPVRPPKPAALDHNEEAFEVVYLKYADVSEIVGLLTDGLTVKPNDYFVPREPAFGSQSGSGPAYSPIPQQTTGPSDDPLAQSVDALISIDRRLNAVVLHGPQDVVDRLKQKIAKIDVPVESVSLETIFVELSETGAKNVGLDFNNTNGQLAIATYQTGQYVPFGLSRSELTSISMQAAIYAQVQQGQGRVVSKPRISAQSGGTAKIITGDALPILTSIQLSGVNGVSQQVQYVNVGVTLQIAPRVSDDGFVSSHVFCVVSNVTGFSQGYPTISQREAETSATVHDGETFVIGGLTQENLLDSESHIPVLGDIPLLGRLFSLDKDTNTKTELYIVVTPHIVRRGQPMQSPSEVRLGPDGQPVTAPPEGAPPPPPPPSAPPPDAPPH
jgi:general secretion pathway protein D